MYLLGYSEVNHERVLPVRHVFSYLLADFVVDFDPLTMALLQGHFSSKESDAFNLYC